MPPEPVQSHVDYRTVPRRWVWPADAVAQAGTMNWHQRRLRAGLALMPAVALCLIFGVATGDLTSGIMAVGGAVTVGTSAFRPLAARNRATPLGFTLGMMALSTFVGSVGHSGGWAVDVAIALAWGYFYGVGTTLGYGAWWVGLQGVIGLLAFGSIPASPAGAAYHAAMIVAGGLLQLANLYGVWRFTAVSYDAADAIPRAWWRRMLRNAAPGRASGRHALRVALALGVGSGIEHAFHLSHGYWVPMTAAILLKPDFHETLTRGVGRLAGTLAGTGLVTVIVALLRPEPVGLACGVLLAVWGCFALVRVNYALFATCITAYVVMSLAAAGLPEPPTALARVEATLIGAAVALVAHAIPLGRKRDTDLDAR